MNHSSLIVDSAANQKANGEFNINFNDRYTASKKNRGNNAMSELRKSSKAPINSKKVP